MSVSTTVPKGAWSVWTVAVLIYLMAVFHRSSLAVAGLVATDRFGISASQLATFVMLQLLLYALMQIPAGLLVDRLGPRAVLAVGTTLVIVAQVGFALAESYPAALAARFLLGVGDAMTFICVLRLVATWFPARRNPLMNQFTGATGQLGAVAAAAPMTWALRELGWTTAYLIAAGVSLLLLVVLLVVVLDHPERRSVRGAPLSWASIRARLAESWRQPGTRLGFWMHFTSQFPAVTLGLLWGYPFFVRGEGLSSAQAGTLLSVMVFVIIGAGPVLGWAIGRHPWHRSSIVIGVVLAIVVVWTVVLVWPGNAPIWLLVALVTVVGVGGPASVIGFDLARTSNPVERVGSATAIVNQAGFIASLVLVIVIGLILDWRTPGSSVAYTPESFRWALSAPYVLWALGLAQLWRWRRRTRAELLAENPDARSLMTRLG